jgi:hypothetical protein
LDLIQDDLTDSTAQILQRRVNVNAAPAGVLRCISGLDDTDADKLIAQRAGNDPTSDSIAWVADALGRDKAVAIGNRITWKTLQYSADIVATSGNGRSFKRVRIVVDTQSGTPQIVYRRDITDRGWPMDKELLASIRRGEMVSTGGGGGGAGTGMMPGSRSSAEAGSNSMIGRSTSFLGLAISERAVVCAEVAARGAGGGTARRTATFTLPPELSLDAKPESVGTVLSVFLRENKFTASRCVVGVPARWLIAVEKEVPPSDPVAARAMLRLQAERLAVAENGEVVFDFAANPNPTPPPKVLLVGMLRSRLERIEKIVQAAGLELEAVTSSGLSLAACAVGGKGEGRAARAHARGRGNRLAARQRAAHASPCRRLRGERPGPGQHGARSPPNSAAPSRSRRPTAAAGTCSCSTDSGSKTRR